ncbi:hypothetical protein [Sorangium sp. So ce693]|uniref:hypothetical protein n=1 Tax=Sorangium sp. So ce693 TaxID=3133318 RepID=UPI003F5FD422
MNAARRPCPALRCRSPGTGSPGPAHERFFDLLRGQGYEIDRFLRAYERDGLAGRRARRKATLAAQRGILPQQRHPA